MENNIGDSQLMVLTKPVMYHELTGLVYIPIDKTGSTYFKELLTQNGFERLENFTVDHNKHHTFGFILDPKIRYHKGIAEDLNDIHSDYPDEIIKILSDERCQIITDHCAPIIPNYVCDMSHAMNIDWIPLDKNSERYLSKLFEFHGLTLKVYEGIYHNESIDSKKEFYNAIKDTNIFHTHYQKRWIYGYYMEDRWLWDSVSIQFNQITTTDKWEDISWFNKIGAEDYLNSKRQHLYKSF